MMMRLTTLTIHRADRGLNRLRGTTSIAGSPNIPTSRRVQLLRSVNVPVLVAKTWSDAAGAWAFDGIAPRQNGAGYTVISYDHTGVHAPAAAASLIPTPTPPDPAEHP
ncbi:hypothetical protein [Aromatoleum anaerobium]|uniref:Uncharacterized protein n=1 Tax=Aromatoleum anaerobium TaxID=182180 RepID=A0ABX1PS66_9RHOO|nr:hypothetical protein [Aromatoleum anaerobium]MCK0508463.1 hypothetical protein [Aromatoleum anaerobium]